VVGPRVDPGDACGDGGYKQHGADGGANRAGVLCEEQGRKAEVFVAADAMLPTTTRQRHTKIRQEHETKRENRHTLTRDDVSQLFKHQVKQSRRGMPPRTACPRKPHGESSGHTVDPKLSSTRPST